MKNTIIAILVVLFAVSSITIYNLTNKIKGLESDVSMYKDSDEFHVEGLEVVIEERDKLKIEIEKLKSDVRMYKDSDEFHIEGLEVVIEERDKLKIEIGECKK